MYINKYFEHINQLLTRKPGYKLQISKISENMKTHAVALAISKGVKQFGTFYNNYIEEKVYSPDYGMQFEQPKDLSFIQEKFELMGKVIKHTFCDDLENVPEKLLEFARKYSNLPPSLPILQLMDTELLKLLPSVSAEMSNDIHNTVYSSKRILLNKDLARLSPDIVLEQLTGIMHQSGDEKEPAKFTNEVRCVITVHIAAWILPFTAVAQYESEKKKNVATLIAEEKESICRYFIGLCNESKDRIAAEDFCNTIRHTIREGATARAFPMMYDWLRRNQAEFSTKKVFLGHAFADLCRNNNYQEITGFLHNFENIGLRWTLRCLSFVCNRQENSLLHKTYEKCITTFRYLTIYRAYFKDLTLQLSHRGLRHLSTHFRKLLD